MRLDEIAQQPTADKNVIEDNLRKLFILSRSTINDDGSVDVNGDVTLPFSTHEIPVPFRRVSGNFACANTLIKSLHNAPHYVGGSFRCDKTQITSLAFGPEYVGGSYGTYRTNISSLQHISSHIGGDLMYDSTNITSLHNIHKTHANLVVGGEMWLPRTCTHLLGLAYIPGVKQIKVGSLNNTIDVIHDVFEWQEKLLELGLVEQAQL